MRKTMKAISWLVFLAFIGLSSYANWMHGQTPHARVMLAVVPCGFAAAVFLYEGMTSAGKETTWWQHVGVGAVAACSGVASYLGLFGMARDNGIPLVQAALLPLAYDGVVAVASMAIRSFSLTHVPPVPKVSRPRRVPVSLADVPAVPVAVTHVSRTDVPVTRATDWDRDKARRLLAEGRPRKEVADLCGVSRKSIDRLANTE